MSKRLLGDSPREKVLDALLILIEEATELIKDYRRVAQNEAHLSDLKRYGR